MAYYIVNLGSNLGQRRLFLSKAMRAIGDEFGEFEMSHVCETEPQGFESEHKFLNLCMMFRSDDEPIEVLEKLRKIELSISNVSHRNIDGSYADREIDIDIVAVDDMIIDTATLKVPHRHLAEREGFLRPLIEVAPGWVHPETGATAREMLDRLLEKNERVGGCNQ